MAAIRTPLAKKSKGTSVIIVYSLTPETVPRNTFFKKNAIQEGPGRFREGFREGRLCIVRSVSIRFWTNMIGVPDNFDVLRL